MNSRSRVVVVALAGALSVPIVVAAVAWACSPSGYGTPESPPPPGSTVQPVTPSTTSGPPPSVQPPEGAVDVNLNTTGAVTNTTRSVVRSAPKPATTPNRGVTVGRSAPVSSNRAGLAARLQGSTAGVVQRGGKPVFASSTAPRKAKASQGKAGRSPAKSPVPVVSERAATSDLWSAVTGNNPSLDTAASAAGDRGGLSGAAIAGLAILGLGLAGLAGGALVSAGSRRRAGARTRK